MDLSDPGTVERGRLLFRLGRARFVAGDEDPAALTAAREELLAAGDQESAAEAEATLAELAWIRADMPAAMAPWDAHASSSKGVPSLAPRHW